VIKKKSNKQKKKGKARLFKGISYPPMPSSLKVKLRARTYETGTATSNVDYRYGLVEFLGKQSSYNDSLYGLYNYAIIRASRITAKLVNMQAEPIVFAIAPLPYDWSSGSPTTTELLDVPRCVKATVSGVGGMDRAQITNAITSKQALGEAWQVARYQMNAAQAANTTPLSSEEPTWHLYVTSFNSSTGVGYRIEVELEYDVEFYNLNSV
jgi:hypothetical protein